MQRVNEYQESQIVQRLRDFSRSSRGSLRQESGSETRSNNSHILQDMEERFKKYQIKREHSRAKLEYEVSTKLQ